MKRKDLPVVKEMNIDVDFNADVPVVNSSLVNGREEYELTATFEIDTDDLSSLIALAELFDCALYDDGERMWIGPNVEIVPTDDA